MVLLDLFFSLLVVICQGNQNQRELDVSDRERLVQQVLLQFHDERFLYQSFYDYKNFRSVLEVKGIY